MYGTCGLVFGRSLNNVGVRNIKTDVTLVLSTIETVAYGLVNTCSQAYVLFLWPLRNRQCSCRSPANPENHVLRFWRPGIIPKVYKKLSYRRGTARILINSFSVSRAMRVIKVSNSKSDLQGPSRALALVPVDRPHTISYQSPIATMTLSCTVSEILSFISRNLKRSCDQNTVVLEVVCYACTRLLCISISTRNLKYLASPIRNI